MEADRWIFVASNLTFILIVFFCNLVYFFCTFYGHDSERETGNCVLEEKELHYSIELRAEIEPRALGSRSPTLIGHLHYIYI